MYKRNEGKIHVGKFFIVSYIAAILYKKVAYFDFDVTGKEID